MLLFGYTENNQTLTTMERNGTMEQHRIVRAVPDMRASIQILYLSLVIAMR